jgi:HK97 family phage major capsid protein
MRDFLKKLIKAKEDKANELRAAIKAAETADEVRALGETLDTVLSELQDAKDQLAELDGEGEGEGDTGTNANESDDSQRSNIPEGAEYRGFNPLARFNQNVKRTAENPLDSMEYRQAFMKYVQTGEWNYRADETLLTSDVGKIIPNTIMNEFIKELKVYGQLYSLVRKLNIKGGVEFPIEELVPTVTWITETTVSETQAVPNFKNSISFGYHIVEARISQSLLSQVVSLPVLEQEIAKLLAEAFVKEFDRIIVKGTGSGQPLGILNDTRVAADHKITFAAADMADWTKFRKNLFAKIPLAYRGQGILIMTAGTWESNIMTLKDSNNRPLYQETYDPTTGQLECRFAGRQVVLVEPDILADYDTASTGDVWGIYLRPQDYAINSNLQIGFKRWFDDDKNKYFNKGLCIMDGKLVDVNGVYILKK